jgi:hypothetical protein
MTLLFGVAAAAVFVRRRKAKGEKGPAMLAA